MKRLRSLVITQESSLSTETMNFALCTKNQTTKKTHLEQEKSKLKSLKMTFE